MSEITADWGGAQWVLATVIVVLLLLPLFARMAGVTVPGNPRKANIQWTGWYLGRLIEKAALVSILAWGGFW